MKQNYKKFENCLFCSGEIKSKGYRTPDRLFTTKKLFDLSECLVCKSAFINPMPIGDASMYYPENYLSGEQSSAEAGSKHDAEKWYRYNQYSFDFRMAEKSMKKNIGTVASYLDVGCGSGERVAYIKERGCSNSVGLDKFDFAKSKVRDDINIVNSDVYKYKPTKQFDVVSLFHVLEHIEDPKKMLIYIKEHILNKNSYLVIQVPNYGSIERRIFGPGWFCLDVPRHLLQFNKRSISKALEDSGYRVCKVHQRNAILHPVTLVPSLFKELDVQRIWVRRDRGILYKRSMTILWMLATAATIPLNLIQNILGRSSMLTVIAKTKDN